MAAQQIPDRSRIMNASIPDYVSTAERIRGLEPYLSSRVKGQSQAISRVCSLLERGQFGLNPIDRPLGSFLFLGPTGVGKTQLTLEFARYLFEENHVFRFEVAMKRVPRMPDTFEIHEPTAEEQAEALKQFYAASGAVKKRREQAAAQLMPVLEKITEALTKHWSTGSGRRLRQIVWSIYNGRTLVILGDVLTNFDGELGEAVATLIHARLCGVDMDDLLREVFKRSGEFARYEEAERETPKDEIVIYPASALIGRVSAPARPLRGQARGAHRGRASPGGAALRRLSTNARPGAVSCRGRQSRTGAHSAGRSRFKGGHTPTGASCSKPSPRTANFLR
jgi:hypothetical protein